MEMNHKTAPRTIRADRISIDVSIISRLEHSPDAGTPDSGEVYLAVIAPNMELTVITLDEAPRILPCFDETDVCEEIGEEPLLLSYHPAQTLTLAGKTYLTGPVIFFRVDENGKTISLTVDDIYLFQKYLDTHSSTLMADDRKLPCICLD